ncbi:MAG: hypothetical protein AAB789_01980 [Patescibacteria group bacterium]
MNLLKLISAQLVQEWAVLLLAVSWVLLRLLKVVVLRLEEGKRLRVEVFGKELIEVESLNLVQKHGGRNIHGEENTKNNRTPQGKGKILHIVV